MPGNVEVKAKVKDIEELRKRARAITEEHYPLQQCDVFFKALGDCRLKMRMEENESTGEKKAMLIAYSRPDVTGPKFSHYVLTPVEDPTTMEAALKMSNGVLGKVEKKRDAYIVQRNGLSARIHLDVVKDLGDFLEFEVIVKEDSEMKEAHSFAEYLSGYFGVSQEDTLPGAYFNLLQK